MAERRVKQTRSRRTTKEAASSNSNNKTADPGNKTHKNSTSVLRQPKNVIIGILAITFVLSLILLVFWPILVTSGIPPGSDITSFLHTSKFMVDQVIQNKTLPPTDPHWYSGLEYLHYAPPLINIPIGLFYLITNNIRLAGKLFEVFLMCAIALSMFLVVSKKHGIYSGAIAAIAFAFTQWTFSAIFLSPTKGVGVIFFPICFYFTDMVLSKRDNRYIVALALSFAGALLGHPMIGLTIMIGLIVYAVVFSSLSKDISINRVFFVISAAFLGGTLTSYFIIPFYLEKTSWTSVPVANIIGNSLSIRTLTMHIGAPLLILGLFSVLWHRDPKRIALLVTCAFGCFLSLGTHVLGSFYQAIPILNLIYPGLWMVLAVFSLAYLTAITIDFNRIQGIGAELKRAVVAVLTIAVIFIVVDQDVQMIDIQNLQNVQSKASDVLVTMKLNSAGGDGRVAPMKYQFGYLIWELNNRTNKGLVEGHYYAIAGTGQSIANSYDAIDHGYLNYAISSLAHNNVEYVLVNKNLLEVRKHYGLQFIRELRKNGYDVISSVYDANGKAYDIYRRQTKSSYLIPNRARTLVIGKYAYTAAAVLSQNEETVIAGSPYIDDYDNAFLKNFDSLILYGFAYHSRPQAEAIIKDYVARGGQVTIDLFGTKLYGTENNPSFLGVAGYEQNTQKSFTIEKTSKQADTYFSYEKFILPYELTDDGQRTKRLTEWRFMEYVGLDQPLARIMSDTNKMNIPIAGFKKVAGSKVLFTGPNLFYHVYLTHNKKEIQRLSALQNPGKNQPKADANNQRSSLSSRTNGVNVTSQSIQLDRLRFNYVAEKNSSAFISYTYSKHWKAFIDGQETPVARVEDLMFVNVPKGKHTLTLLYKDIPIHFFARALSILTIIFFGWLIARDIGKKRGIAPSQ